MSGMQDEHTFGGDLRQLWDGLKQRFVRAVRYTNTIAALLRDPSFAYSTASAKGTPRLSPWQLLLITLAALPFLKGLVTIAINQGLVQRGHTLADEFDEAKVTVVLSWLLQPLQLLLGAALTVAVLFGLSLVGRPRFYPFVRMCAYFYAASIVLFTAVEVAMLFYPVSPVEPMSEQGKLSKAANAAGQEMLSGCLFFACFALVPALMSYHALPTRIFRWRNRGLQLVCLWCAGLLFVNWVFDRWVFPFAVPIVQKVAQMITLH